MSIIKPHKPKTLKPETSHILELIYKPDPESLHPHLPQQYVETWQALCPLTVCLGFRVWVRNTLIRSLNTITLILRTLQKRTPNFRKPRAMQDVVHLPLRTRRACFDSLPSIQRVHDPLPVACLEGDTRDDNLGCC